VRFAGQETVEMIVADLRNMTAQWDAPPWRVILLAVAKSTTSPALRGVMWIRAGMWCWSRGWRAPAHLCKARAVCVCGAEVHPAAIIGPGLALNHSVGIVIGHDVVVGRNLLLHHGVTLGHGGNSARGQPTVGDDVRIGAGAILLGGIRVGDRARIGAGAIVLSDVPADVTVVGTWTLSNQEGREP
jgi:serine O-acetyltransferase